MAVPERLRHEYQLPLSGPGAEIGIGGGTKLKALNGKLSADLGYVRYTYPGVPASFSYDYGEIVATIGHDFDLFQIKARLRYSANSFGNSGVSWNKRVRAPESGLLVLAIRAGGRGVRPRVDRGLHRHEHRPRRMRQHCLLFRTRFHQHDEEVFLSAVVD